MLTSAPLSASICTSTSFNFTLTHLLVVPTPPIRLTFFACDKCSAACPKNSSSELVDSPASVVFFILLLTLPLVSVFLICYYGIYTQLRSYSICDIYYISFQTHGNLFLSHAHRVIHNSNISTVSSDVEIHLSPVRTARDQHGRHVPFPYLVFGAQYLRSGLLQ